VLNCTGPTLFNIRITDCDKPEFVQCRTYMILPRPSLPNMPVSTPGEFFNTVISNF
jgi:hypothetical protein